MTIIVPREMGDEGEIFIASSLSLTFSSSQTFIIFAFIVVRCAELCNVSALKRVHDFRTRNYIAPLALLNLLVNSSKRRADFRMIHIYDSRVCHMSHLYRAAY